LDSAIEPVTRARPEVDRNALEILHKTYWSSTGWKAEDEQVTPPDDLLYAKRAGVMFDPVRLSHDQITRNAIEVVARVAAGAVADAFLASLSTRRLELRSALGSFAVLRHFPEHEFSGDRSCMVCGGAGERHEVHDLNVLNFERYKWGGVRHDDPLYAAFDLEQFLRCERLEPAEADIALFRGILGAIEAVPGETTAPKLQARLGKLLPSNKAEREVLINILGHCCILRTPGHPSYFDGFVPECERTIPSYRNVDMAYPACWWRGRDGIVRTVLRSFFPDLDL
jgi:hypothetical protein